MIYVDFTKLDSNSPETESLKDSVYNAIQEEICHVIEYGGQKTDPQNNHELYDVIREIQLRSPYQRIFDFQSDTKEVSLDECSTKRITQDLGIRLDSHLHQGVIFKICLFTQMTEGAPFELKAYGFAYFSYQEKSGMWVSQNLGTTGIFPSHPVIASDALTLNLAEEMSGPTDFELMIGSDGELSIRSQSLCYLRPTRIILSHFQFIRRGVT